MAFVEHKAPGELPSVIDRESSLTPMKLSQAIREGAKIRAQAYSSFFVDGRSCAIGAALEGAGGEYDEHNAVEPLHHRFPNVIACDKNGYRYTELGSQIYKMNDSGATREQIADWLEAQGY